MDPTRHSTGALSLEALLDEENREVLAAMEKRRSKSPNTRISRGATPPPPVRSMLDVDGSAPRHGSIAGIGVGITNPRDHRTPSSRLNPADPSTWTRPHRPSSPGPGRLSLDADFHAHVVPRIQIDDEDGSAIKDDLDPPAMSTPTKTSHGTEVKDEEAKHSSPIDNTPRQVQSGRSTSQHSANNNHKSKIPRSRSPAMSKLSPSRASRTQRSMSNKSSSLSDVSDVPSEFVGRAGLDDEEVVAESSDENDDQSSSDGDAPEGGRGRVREKDITESNGGVGMLHAEDGTPPQSRGVRSLIDPSPSSLARNVQPSESHASSSFGRSGPNASDFERDPIDDDIRKAKNLALNISPVDDSIKDRHVRMIIRGAWAKFQDSTHNSNHTSRLYLVCSDLSTEASYALEWTVGTMLRDGDTLLAIYAIEDESAPKEPEGNREVMAESAKAAHDASETMAALTRQTTNLSVSIGSTSKFIPVTEATSLLNSIDANNVSKREMERLKAMDEITQSFLKLVRKTTLQIRCMVEVIHCKSPKHLILNAIDELDPTLCVVGTRGRSSLKGVLLGSFSNYLVNKSSVPVMVARKRLKRARHAKVSSTSIRLSNNLTNTILPRQRKTLDQARID